MYRTMDETESKTPSFMVLVQEQLNSLILSSFLFYISKKVKEPGDFTSDTLALDERLVTLISVKIERSEKLHP